MKKLLLIVNCILLAIGNCGGPLIMRLYFIHGGTKVWLSSWLETGGWPIILIPLVAAYIIRRKTEGSNAKLIFMKPFIFFGSAIIGCLFGLDDYLYAYGVSKLPVSTSSLLIASQLAFVAGFGFLIVKQKFTAYSINAVVLLTVGAAVLALGSNSDRPEGESKKQYVVGFVMTLAAAALYGFVLPLVELVYKKANQAITYTLVLEMQIVICFFATAFCTIGMVINNDFKAIPREAKEFELGELKYYVIAVLSGIIWQGFFLGAIGVVFCASSLLSGIVVAVTLPITEILAVIFYHESFEGQKIVSLILSLWGFVSYLYGEKKYSKDQIPNMESQHKSPQTEMASTVTP